MARFVLFILCVFATIFLKVSYVRCQDSDIDSDRIFQDLLDENDDDFNTNQFEDGDIDVVGHSNSGPGENNPIPGRNLDGSLQYSDDQGSNLQEILALTSTVVSWLKAYLKDSYTKIPNPSVCVQDVKMLLDDALSNKKWTIPFVDSAGKPGPSVSLGWFNFVGNLDQCEEGKAPPLPQSTDRDGKSQQRNHHVFRGQYCVLTLALVSVPLARLKFGICVPDSCTDAELASLSSQILTQFKADSNLTFVSAKCIKNETDVSAATIISIIVLAVVGCLVITGTVFDLIFLQREKDSKATGFDNLSSNYKSTESSTLDFKTKSVGYDTISSTQTNGIPNYSGTSESKSHIHPFVLNILVAFSLYTNGKKILSTSQGQDSFTAINGMRYFSIAWVLIGHLYLLAINFAANTPTEVEKYYERLSFIPVSNAFSSVDTFFTISGLLTSYSILKQLKDKNTWRINWASYYFHRVWRLTPPYMAILLLGLGMSQYFGSGPMWANRQPFDKGFCEDSWWKNLLYINNFEKIFESCMMQSWYLANDMQFFLLSPLMTIPLFIRPKIGIAVCSVFILAGWITTGVSSSVNDWITAPFAKHADSGDAQDWMNDYYTRPWFRIGPYVVGILGGYILTVTKGKSLQMKWYVVALGWIVASATALSVVYGLHGDISGKHVSSTDIAALYNAVSHTIWGVVICWIIIACDAGYGGPVNTFLSWKPFVVLGRLTYMIYLIHVYILAVFYENMGLPFFMNNTTMAVSFSGILATCTCLALFLNLLFESPMIGLEKVFRKGKKSI